MSSRDVVTGELVEVFAGTPVDAEVLRGVLEDEGIPAMVHGETNAMGAGFVSFTPVRVLVLEEHATRAAELVASLEHPDAEVADEDAPEELRSARKDGPGPAADPLDPPPAEGPYRSAPRGAETARPEAPPRRLARVAGFAAVFPGGANLYARHSITAVSLLLCFLLSVMWVMPHVSLYVVWGLVFFADLATGLAAVARCNAGRIASPWAQLVIGVAAWVVVDAILWVLVSAVQAYGYR